MNIENVLQIPSLQSHSGQTVNKESHSIIPSFAESLQLFQNSFSETTDTVEEVILKEETTEIDWQDLFIDEEMNNELMARFEGLKEWFTDGNEHSLLEDETKMEQFLSFYFQLSIMNENEFTQIDHKLIEKLNQKAHTLIEYASKHSLMMDMKQIEQLETVVSNVEQYMKQLFAKRNNHQEIPNLPSTSKQMSLDTTPNRILFAQQIHSRLTEQKGEQKQPNQKDLVNRIFPLQAKTEENEQINTVSKLNGVHMTKLEQFVWHIGDLQEGKQVSKLIHEFEQILARAQFSQTPNGTRLSIKLFPENLGTLQVELTQKDGVLIANLITSSNRAKQLIESQLHSLRQSFVHQNVQVEKIEITFSQNEMNETYNENEQQSENQNQKQAEQEALLENTQDDHEQTRFSDQLREILFETEI